MLPQKFLEHSQFVLWETVPKENSVIRQKSNILASTKCLGWQRYWSEKPRLQGTDIPLTEISNKLLLCNNWNDALTYVPFFIFRCCESVVLYIILLETARKLSRFCKMARRWKVVGPRWIKLFTQKYRSMVNGLLFHMTQPTSRSIIKAIACSKPIVSKH